MKKLSSLIFLLFILTSVASAQEIGKLSGYLFGDYYYVASNHNEALEKENGFWSGGFTSPMIRDWVKTLTFAFASR